MLDNRGIEEMATALVVAVYTLGSLVYHNLATFSFTHFNFSMGNAVFTIGGIGVSTASLLSIALPVVVYVINDNYPMQTTLQTYVAGIPVASGVLMLISPPIASAITGSAFLSTVFFGVSAICVGVVAGPNDFPN